MILGELLRVLKELDSNIIIEDGFHNPHSYRGYYEELAVEPKDNVSIGEMIATLKAALGSTYRGYKGGDWFMSEECRVFVAYEGCCGSLIDGVLINENGYRLSTTRDYI